MTELVISYLSPRFFTLLVLAGDARGAAVGQAWRSNERGTRVFGVGRGVGRGHARRRCLPCARGPAIAYPRGYGRVAECGKNPYLLTQEGWMDQVGSAMLLCSLVAVECAEEVLWRIARVYWTVTDPTYPHSDAMVAS